MHAVKLLTFQPMMNPVRICLEHRWDGQKTFEIAADELMVEKLCGSGIKSFLSVANVPELKSGMDSPVSMFRV